MIWAINANPKELSQLVCLDVRFRFSMPVIIVFWVVTPCSLYIDMYQGFAQKMWATELSALHRLRR